MSAATALPRLTVVLACATGCATPGQSFDSGPQLTTRLVPGLSERREIRIAAAAEEPFSAEFQLLWSLDEIRPDDGSEIGQSILSCAPPHEDFDAGTFGEDMPVPLVGARSRTSVSMVEIPFEAVCIVSIEAAADVPADAEVVWHVEAGIVWEDGGEGTVEIQVGEPA